MLIKCLIDNFAFWLWHRNIAIGLDNNPIGLFIWNQRVEFIYKPLFKKQGWSAVIEAHNKYVDSL